MGDRFGNIFWLSANDKHVLKKLFFTFPFHPTWACSKIVDSFVAKISLALTNASYACLAALRAITVDGRNCFVIR